jgi:hypothetical protein
VVILLFFCCFDHGFVVLILARGFHMALLFFFCFVWLSWF